VALLELLAFDADDPGVLRGDHVVLTVRGQRVLLHRSLIGEIASAFAKRARLAPELDDPASDGERLHPA
jgi:hypothetical protein